MRTNDHAQFRTLQAEDEPTVREWLGEYLAQHITGWVGAHGLAWGPIEIHEHIVARGLIERDFAELVAASSNPHELVELAINESTPVGILHATQRIDRYLGIRLGVVSWIYVTATQRRRGIAHTLLQRSLAWMRSHGIHAAEVFVTASNVAALRSYQRAGFTTVDARAIAPLRR